LADLLDDQDRTREAADCLKRALAADPAYADAVFNLGLFLQRLDQPAEAAGWWRRYLELDGSSPWAARARRALEYFEMSLAGAWGVHEGYRDAGVPFSAPGSRALASPAPSTGAGRGGGGQPARPCLWHPPPQPSPARGEGVIGRVREGVIGRVREGVTGRTR